MRPQRSHARAIVRLRGLRVGVLREIHRDDPGRASPGLSDPEVGEPGGDGAVAFGVEADAVDDRAVLREPEDAWLGVACLRERGDATDLDEAEAQLQLR